MYRILWLSRHEPTKAQVKELRELFGRVQLIKLPVTISAGSDVRAYMEKHHCDDVVVVLSPDLLEEVVRSGVKPLRAVMDRKTGRHLRFERVIDMKMVSERPVSA